MSGDAFDVSTHPIAQQYASVDTLKLSYFFLAFCRSSRSPSKQAKLNHLSGADSFFSENIN